MKEFAIGLLILAGVGVIAMIAGIATGEFYVGVFIKFMIGLFIAVPWAIRTIKKEIAKEKETQNHGNE